MTEQRLPGGRSFGAVRVGDEVRRPAQPWTATVHSVLRHLEDAGFDGAPRARGFDEQGRERLTFLPGQTLGETTPWPDWLRSDDALRQVGAWLRRLHDATATFRPAADAVWFFHRPGRVRVDCGPVRPAGAPASGQIVPARCAFRGGHPLVLAVGGAGR